MNSKLMKLMVGLANAGKIYAHNHHSVGYQCLNHVARLDYVRPDHRRDVVISQH